MRFTKLSSNAFHETNFNEVFKYYIHMIYGKAALVTSDHPHPYMFVLYIPITVMYIFAM